MKGNRSMSFAKQLIIYLLLVLIVAFLFISLILTNTLQKFVESTTTSQIETVVDKSLVTFKETISKIEDIPLNILDKFEFLNHDNIASFSHLTIEDTPFLNSISVYLDNENPDYKIVPGIADLKNGGKINFFHFSDLAGDNMPDAFDMDRKGSFWSHSTNENILTYYHPIYDKKNKKCGFIKLDCHLKKLINQIYNSHLFNLGNFFIIDSLGEYILSPEKMENTSAGLFEKLNEEIAKGKTDNSLLVVNDDMHYIYLTPIEQINWKLGYIFPYHDVVTLTNKIYFLVFASLGFGLLFILVATISIVYFFSKPLKKLSYAAKQIADGQFNFKLSIPKTTFEIKDLYISFEYMRQKLVEYIERLKTTTAEKEQFNAEMRMARNIQQSFLPRKISLPPNIEFHAELCQSKEVGGDLYDYFLRENKLYFSIGDVCGKGMPAALYMASITKLFHYVASIHTSTATICNILNKQMCNPYETLETDMYITMFMGILDIDTGEMTFTNAGHRYPIIVEKDKDIQLLNKYPDAPIGVIEDYSFSEHTYTIKNDSVLLFYTDGITDTENEEGQFYGNERLIECVRNAARKTPQLLIQEILKDIERHKKAKRLSDDMTLLSISYKKTSGE